MTEQTADLKTGVQQFPAPFVIGELDPHVHRHAILALLGEIYPGVQPAILTERLDVIQASGWRCAGVLTDAQLIALSGFWVQTRFYCGRYLYIDHFVVTSQLRSLRIGSQLLSYMHDCAAAEGCEQTCLDTFMSNVSAQRFWQRAGYSPVGLHFVRPVGPVEAGRHPAIEESQGHDDRQPN